MEQTKDNDKHVINFAMAYGGRQEVVDAAKKIAEQIKQGKLDIDQINEDTFSRNLYFNSEPDLIIRTGGAHRTSNFLLWQAHYSEWLFLEKFWPEFEKEDLVKAIDDYGNRERRFGK
ncbi:di-trans,poly-cis-decaprenylcistransferase, partial [Candidatus Woesearchaeota archaeon]|nr:di-trans,poly-cis-decaprenylcistransferase [Candidatus Woesearchaeota archaeon]